MRGDDAYAILKKKMQDMQGEKIQESVNRYFDEHPVQAGATAEQVQQIEQNKKDVNSLREDISTKITKFYASSQGETHLADSDNGKIMDMMLYGKSEQKRYSGKNLLNATLQTTTQNGVTCTANGDGTYTINGTATSDTLFHIGYFIFEKDTKYKIVGCPQGGSLNTLYRLDGSLNANSDTGNGIVYSGDGNKRNARIVVFNGARVNNLLFKPMITTDLTATYDDFEPYTGGQPSPSPDYPQEIKSVVNPTVKIVGKNLLKATLQTTTQNGITCTANGDGTYTLNGTATERTEFIIDVFNIDISKKYKLIAFTKERSYINCFIQLNQSPWTIYGASTDSQVTITDSKNIRLVIAVIKGTTLSNEIIKPMIVDASLYPDATYDDFEPYHEQTVTLPYTLNAIPVSSGGNVTIDGQQYVSDYVDVERGKLVRRVLKFDPSLLSVRRKDDEKTLFTYDKFDNNNMYKKVHGEIIAECSHLKVTQNTAIGADQEFKNGIHVSFYVAEDGQGNSNVIYICVPPACGTTALEFLEWSNKNAFEIIYELATHTEIDLTPEEITAFKALATYYPTTNISINSEQLDGYTVFNYPISMENGWNYVKQQIGDTRNYIYDMDARTQDTDLQAAEAYVNSEYAVALTELEV